eukprot:scaffold1401_cov330-Pavlova_lutheri.AAC.18
MGKWLAIDDLTKSIPIGIWEDHRNNNKGFPLPGARPCTFSSAIHERKFVYIPRDHRSNPAGAPFPFCARGLVSHALDSCLTVRRAPDRQWTRGSASCQGGRQQWTIALWCYPDRSLGACPTLCDLDIVN